jgi:hypothetical protein
MFSSSAAATAEAMTGAPRRAEAVNGFAGGSAGNGSGQSEQHRSFWESPRRGATQAANHKRACKGGREIRIRVSDGPVMDRRDRPCSIIFATGLIQSAHAR